jgi:hypothetical protein
MASVPQVAEFPHGWVENGGHLTAAETHTQQVTTTVTQILKIIHFGWVPVAHACNPSYSGVRDQDDLGSKPAWANSSWKKH